MNKYIADYLVKMYRDNQYLDFANTTANKKAAVIIESRSDFFLEPVIINMRVLLGRGWNYYLYHTDYNSNFLKTFKIEKRSIGQGKINEESYNTLLTSKEFWETFNEEKIFIFQTDSVMLNKNMDEFMEYDFIGAYCGEYKDTLFYNGGFSLRSKEMCLDVIDQLEPFREATISAPPYNVVNQEDVFFSKGAKILGYNLPDADTCLRFAGEASTSNQPVGLHGTNKYYLPDQVYKQLMEGT